MGKPKRSRDRSLFHPARYKYLADIVRIDTVENAKKAVKKLLKHFRNAKTRAKKVRVKKATVLAATRARVLSKSPRISPRERQEFREVARIYERAAAKMKLPPKR